MSFQERRTLTTVITGAAVLAAYCIYAFGKYQSGVVAAGDLKFWAVTMLIFIGIGVAVTIVISIVFSIVSSIAIAITEKIRNNDCDDKEIEKRIGVEMQEDERDKLIELKASKIGYYVSGFGIIGGLVSVVLGYSAAVMLNIMFISMSFGSIVEGISQMVFYRRGI